MPQTIPSAANDIPEIVAVFLSVSAKFTHEIRCDVQFLLGKQAGILRMVMIIAFINILKRITVFASHTSTGQWECLNRHLKIVNTCISDIKHVAPMT